MMEVGGLFFDFEPFRIASGPSRRVRERGRGDGVGATSRHRDAVDVAVRASTRLVSERRQFRERRSAQVQPHFKKCFEAIDAV